MKNNTILQLYIKYWLQFNIKNKAYCNYFFIIHGGFVILKVVKNGKKIEKIAVLST